MKKLKEQVEYQNNGKASTTAMQSKDKRSWLWTKQGLKPGEKLQYYYITHQSIQNQRHKRSKSEEV